MKKILFLTFSYAPYNVTGSFRIMRFVKYLPKYGLKPIVVTADQGKHHINKQLEKEIPEHCQIYRYKSFFKDSQERVKKSIKLYKKEKSEFSDIIYYFIRLIKDFLFSPDVQITWCLRWFWKIIRILKRNNIRVIVITGAPFSLFVLGAVIKKIIGVKVIIDYRDSWLNDTSQCAQSFIRQFHNKWMEKFVINNIDYIITTTSSIKKAIQSKYSYNQIKIIHNGFDPKDYEDLNIVNNKNKKFTIVYAGKFNVLDQAYNPKNIILGLKKILIDEEKMNIDLIVCGNINKPTREWIKDQHIDFINFKGFISRNELIKIENEADAFLHFYYPNKIKDTISIKVFEYAQFKKPILSINTNFSEVSNFLRKTQLGFSCENDSINEIAKSFKELFYIDSSDFERKINFHEINNYNQEKLTKKLVDIIELIEE